MTSARSASSATSCASRAGIDARRRRPAARAARAASACELLGDAGRRAPSIVRAQPASSSSRDGELALRARAPSAARIVGELRERGVERGEDRGVAGVAVVVVVAGLTITPGCASTSARSGAARPSVRRERGAARRARARGRLGRCAARRGAVGARDVDRDRDRAALDARADLRGDLLLERGRDRRARSLRSRKRWLTARRSTVARTPPRSATPRPKPGHAAHGGMNNT